MSQAMQFQEWLDEVRFLDYSFYIKPPPGVMYLQATFRAIDCHTGEWEIQHTRQWILHPNMTKSEVVQTALKLVLASVEHEAREQFKYRGVAVFGPHLSVDKLHALHSDPEVIDAREPALSE